MGLRRLSPGTLVFDGDCGFCTSSARLAERVAPSTVAVAWQLADLSAWNLTAADAGAAVQYVDAAGEVHAAADAVACLLLTGRLWWRLLGALMLLPGVNAVASVLYRLVARYRYRLPGGTPACRIDRT